MYEWKPKRANTKKLNSTAKRAIKTDAG